MAMASDTSAFMCLSANSDSESLPDVILRNGELASSSNGRMFVIYHGSLAFENMKVELDCTGHASGNAAIVRLNGSEDPEFIRGASVSVDKDTEFVMSSAGRGQPMFMIFSTHFRLHSNY